MSRNLQKKEGSIIISEKKYQSGGDVDKRKSLNMAINNYFKQKEMIDESQNMKANFLLHPSSPGGDHAKRSFGDDDYVNLSVNNQDNNVIGKLYEIMRRVKIKQFALQWLNSTPSRMLKKMSPCQFSLINDKSQDFQDSSKRSRKSVLKVFSKWSAFNLINNLNKGINYIPIINPANRYKLIWDVFVSLVLVYAFFFIPIMVCFSIQEQDISYNQMLYSLLLIFVTDGFVNCNTGFYKRGILCKKREKIWRKYQKEQLKIDMISLSSIILYKYIQNLNDSQNYQLILLFILVKWKKISKLYTDIQNKYILRPNFRNVISLMNLFFKILLIAHSCACIWIVIGRLSQYYYKEENWLNNQKVIDSSWEKQYLYAFYFCTVTMTTVGYGDIAPKSPLEIIACTIMVLISAGIFGFTVNTISDILQDFTKKERNIMDKMFIIQRYLMKKSISPGLSKDVTEYLEYYWRQNIESSYEDEEKMIKQLSDQLRKDLLIESNKIVLRDCQIFQNNFSEDVMKSIVSIIQEKNYTPEEIIFTKGDQNNNRSIYFIQEGVVEVFMETTNHFTKSQNQYKQIKRLKKGDYFGEVEFFTDGDRIENVRSVNFVKLLKIDRNDFISMIRNYQQDYEQFCYIKDKLLYQQDFSKVFKKCASCESENHLLEKCPNVNFIANKPKILMKYNRSETQLRNGDSLNVCLLRNSQRFIYYNQDEMLKFTEQFQELNEDFIEDYIYKYLSFDISKCDICTNQFTNHNNNQLTSSNNNNLIHNQTNNVTIDINNQGQNNNTNQTIHNQTSASNNTVAHSSKKISNSFTTADDLQIQQKISLHKKAYLKSALKGSKSINDEFEYYDTISPIKIIRNIKSSIKIRKKKNSESKLTKQSSHYSTFIGQENSSRCIKSNSEFNEQGSPNIDKQFNQSSYNITDSLQSINPQNSYQAIQQNYQEQQLPKHNPNTSIIEWLADSNINNNNNKEISPTLQLRLSQPNNHQQIIFFDLFSGQFERLQIFQFYYPLNNFSFIIQQFQMDSAQKKKMKNKLLQQQRAAISKLVMKNKHITKRDTHKNSLNQSSSNYQQIKRIGEKIEADKERDIKSYKGITLQSLNANNSHYQKGFSVSEFKQKSIRGESFSQTNKTFNSHFKEEEPIEVSNDSSQKIEQNADNPLQYQNISKNAVLSSNILIGEGQVEIQSFQDMALSINKKYNPNKSDLRFAYQELSTNQQTQTFHLDKTKSDKLINFFHTTNTINLNQSQEHYKPREGDLSPSLRESRVNNYNQLDIPNNISAYFDNLYADEQFEQN